MKTKTSPDDLVEALGSLKPDADDITNAWYIGRREQTLQQVLARASATSDAEPEAPTSADVSPKWRRRRRVILAGVAAFAMLGGGAAWAAYTRYADWYTAGVLDGLNCQTDWTAEPGDASHPARQYGGPALTTDPVADCDSYADLTGKARIDDPVAVIWRGWRVVGPRAGLPADAVPITTTEDSRVFELNASLEDPVDGGESRCLDETTGVQFARSELDRLGLSGWTVDTQRRDPADGPCAHVFVAAGAEKTILVRAADSHLTSARTGFATALRERITEECLPLSEAETVVAQVLGDDHHWATSAQLDPAAACTRIDLKIGGSIQALLYGPETARPQLKPTTPASPTLPPFGVEPKPTMTTAGNPLAAVVQQRQTDRVVLHDATEFKIADCMAARGFRYTPHLNSGTAGPNTDLKGLNAGAQERWSRAFMGDPIPMDVDPEQLDDPTIAVVTGPLGGTLAWRTDSCLSIGRAAVQADVVEWRVLEQTIDQLEFQASEEAAGNQRLRSEIEARLATENREAIDRFATLQDAAMTRARAVLAEHR